MNIGDKVEHILSKEWLLIVEKNEITGLLKCRTKDLRLLEFFEFELTKIKK